MVKRIVVLLILLVLNSGFPPTAFSHCEVAKKCQVLMSAKFPPRVPGNPAAGSAKGSGLEQQEYFKKCVANGGQPPENDQQKSAK